MRLPPLTLLLRFCLLNQIGDIHLKPRHATPRGAEDLAG
jgi:hypothetical protein